MSNALGGPVDFCDNPDKYLQKANFVKAVYAPKAGIIAAIDTIALGMSVVGLGGGRIRSSDMIDHSVGLENVIALGEIVEKDSVLLIIHAKDENAYLEAKQRVLAAIKIGSVKPNVQEIYEIFS